MAERVYAHVSGGRLALFVDYDVFGDQGVDRLRTWWMAVSPNGVIRNHFGPSKPPPFGWAESIFSIKPVA